MTRKGFWILAYLVKLDIDITHELTRLTVREVVSPPMYFCVYIV